MSLLPDRRTPQPGADELPVMRRMRKGKGKHAFGQPQIVPWLLGGVASLATLLVLGFILPDATNVIVHSSTAFALFFLLFALGLVANLGRRAGIVAFVVTGLLYGVTAWTPLVGVKSVLVLALLVAFAMFTLAGFNALFVVEEVLYDIHRFITRRGTFWVAMPTLVIVGVTPLVYWLLPLAGLRWPTLQIAWPVVLLLLVIAWVVRWRVGAHGLKVVREATFLAIGTITGAGLADIVAMLRDVEGILPSVIAYLTLIVTWVFISYTTLNRAQYFLRGSDVLPWMALLFSSAFAVLAHVQFLYGAAGTPGLASVSEVRVGYLQLGVWLGLGFFFVRGAWRFFRFVRDQKELGSRTRRTAGRFARVLETVMESTDRVEGVNSRFFGAVERLVPRRRKGSKKKEEEGKGKKRA